MVDIKKEESALTKAVEEFEKEKEEAKAELIRLLIHKGDKIRRESYLLLQELGKNDERLRKLEYKAFGTLEEIREEIRKENRENGSHTTIGRWRGENNDRV